MTENYIRFSVRTWLRKTGRLLSRPAVLFSLLLFWFYWGSSWYPPATLLVSGTVADVSSQVAVRWDSGHGLNGYEWERYPLKRLSVLDETEGVSLIISRTGHHRSASLGAKVVLSNIFVDGQKYIPSPEQLPSGIRFDDGLLVFQKDGASLQLTLHPESHLRLEFLVFNRAGEVDIQVGEEKNRYDLYGSNDETRWSRERIKVFDSWLVTPEGGFTITMPMPRYPIHLLRVEAKGGLDVSSIRIQTEDGQNLDLADGVLYRQGVNFPMDGVDQQLKRYFHPDRFLLQILFALLSTWLLIELFSFAGSFNGVKDVFINEHRFLFWMMLLMSCSLFFFWHLSFWPGVMSTDSLKVWRAAQIPGLYLGDHPILNVIFYQYLATIWNNPAVVPLTQNLLTSLLIAYILFSLYRRGLALHWLLASYLLVVFSLPVGLYTIILWKDIPFALIIVFLGFKLAVFYRQKRCQSLEISRKEWCVLFLFTISLVGFRYNGAVYLLIVPLFVVLFGLVRVRPLLLCIFCAVTVLVGVAFFYIPVPASSGGAAYVVTQARSYLVRSVDRISFNYLKRSGKNYLGIFDVNQKKTQWDLVHLCMYGRYGNDFLRNTRWNDVYPFLPLPENKVMKRTTGIAWALYWKSYQVPWVYFSWNPVYMLFLYPLLPLFYRKLPMTAVFSLFIFIPVAVLVYLGIFNWRYYFFAHLGSYFLLPMIITDLFSSARGQVVRVPSITQISAAGDVNTWMDGK